MLSIVESSSDLKLHNCHAFQPPRWSFRDEFDLDLASFKENATFRFILQNTPDPEFLVCYCQTHFKFGGAERVNMESWPSLKSCPEIIPGIAVKHGKEKNLGRSIRYSSFVLPLWKQRLTG